MWADQKAFTGCQTAGRKRSTKPGSNRFAPADSDSLYGPDKLITASDRGGVKNPPCGDSQNRGPLQARPRGRGRDAGRLRGTIRAARPIRKGRGLRWPFCGYRLRSVEVVQMWLAVAEIGAGPVFWAVALGGNVSDLGLADSVTSRPRRRPCRKRASSLAGFAGKRAESHGSWPVDALDPDQ